MILIRLRNAHNFLRAVVSINVCEMISRQLNSGQFPVRSRIASIIVEPWHVLHSSDDTMKQNWFLKREISFFNQCLCLQLRQRTWSVKQNVVSFLLQPKQSRIWKKSSSTSQKIFPLVRATTYSTAAEGMGLTRITSPLSLSMNVLLSHQDSLKRLLFKLHTFCAIHSPLTCHFVLCS